MLCTFFKILNIPYFKACIIGYRTGKMLYLGIRNKYCCICARSQYKNTNSDIPEHTCFKNWDNTSASMEANIIVEGFANSEKMYGLRFLKLVGDGDSSVHKELLKAKPYGNMMVEKIECRNHLLRNLSSRLRDITSTLCVY